MVSSNKADDPIIEDKLEEQDRSEEDVENLQEWHYYPEPDYSYYPEPDHVYLLMENDVELDYHYPEPDQ